MTLSAHPNRREARVKERISALREHCYRCWVGMMQLTGGFVISTGTTGASSRGRPCWLPRQRRWPPTGRRRAPLPRSARKSSAPCPCSPCWCRWRTFLPAWTSRPSYSGRCGAARRRRGRGLVRGRVKPLRAARLSGTPLPPFDNPCFIFQLSEPRVSRIPCHLSPAKV